MITFRDVKGTKTDDFAFILESTSQVLLPIFLIITGVGVSLYAADNIEDRETKNSIIAMATGLTGAGLLSVNTQKSNKTRDPLFIEEYSKEDRYFNPEDKI